MSQLSNSVVQNKNMKNQKDFTREAKSILRDIREWNGALQDYEIVEAINKDLQIAYLQGFTDSLKENTSNLA